MILGEPRDRSRRDGCWKESFRKTCRRKGILRKERKISTLKKDHWQAPEGERQRASRQRGTNAMRGLLEMRKKILGKNQQRGGKDDFKSAR